MASRRVGRLVSTPGMVETPRLSGEAKILDVPVRTRAIPRLKSGGLIEHDLRFRRSISERVQSNSIRRARESPGLKPGVRSIRGATESRLRGSEECRAAIRGALRSNICRRQDTRVSVAQTCDVARSVSARRKTNGVSSCTAAVRQAAALRAGFIGPWIFESDHSCPRKISSVATSRGLAR